MLKERLVGQARPISKYTNWPAFRINNQHECAICEQYLLVAAKHTYLQPEIRGI